MAVTRVWAPFARQVLMVLDGKHYPLSDTGSGWWMLDSPHARHGTDYAFVLDGSDPLPDPRSPWQPYGVHGFSRMLDHSLFPWTDARWQPPPISCAVIYELHTGTFSPPGTFHGVAEKLDHLVDLGITHVELMPVNSFSGKRGWGYDGVDLFAPHEPYGGPLQLKKLVDACHARGLAVILDVVYNHLGPEGNYLGRFGPYFTDRYSSAWGSAVNFDGPGSDEVRRFFIDNAVMWMKDYHMDALRLDAVHGIIDTSAVHFLEQLSQEVDTLQTQLERNLVLIAESNLNDPRIVEPREIGGYGIDAQWSDDLHHALHTVLTGESNGYYKDFGTLSDLAQAIQEIFVYSGRYSAFRKRRHGRPVRSMSGHRFLAYLQNHDQVGNRAQGDRASHLMNASRLMIGPVVVFASACIPLIFQGEEWGASSPFQYFTDHQDKALGKAVAAGRRNEFAAFGWAPQDVPDPQAAMTFERSRLDWNELGKDPHASIHAWYKSLIRLRRELSELKDGDLGRVLISYNDDEQWMVIQRGSVMAACNFSRQERLIGLYEGQRREVLLASHSAVVLREHSLTMPAESAAILALHRD
jgi:maltooligosyltrehalose trehalohydrolase